MEILLGVFALASAICALQYATVRLVYERGRVIGMKESDKAWHDEICKQIQIAMENKSAW
jgi:hypothetical protein